MIRRKEESFVEVLAELTSKAPWWVGVLLAVASFFLMRWLAAPDLPRSFDPANARDFYSKAILKTLATAGQFVLPFVFLAGALMSVVVRFRRKRLLTNAASASSASVVAGLSWRSFELLVGEAFRKDGFAVVEQGGNGPGGGVDLVLRKGTETFFVQCKHWKSLKVGVDVVRELYGVMAAHGAVGGFVVTSGTFTPDAVEFAEGRNVVLVDGAILREMLQRTRRAPSSNPAPRASPLPTPPKCPLCSSHMVERVAKRGESAGNKFWGCSRYPSCKATRAI